MMQCLCAWGIACKFPILKSTRAALLSDKMALAEAADIVGANRQQRLWLRQKCNSLRL